MLYSSVFARVAAPLRRWPGALRKLIMHNEPRMEGERQALGLAFLCLLEFPGIALGALPSSPWSWDAGLVVKETYDNNVYLQDMTDLASRESFVTSVAPSLTAGWKGGDPFQASLSWVTEGAFYASEPSEDHFAHRANLTLGGRLDRAVWNVKAAGTLIDGSDEGLVFSGPGGAPAAGGVPLRERRDARVLRTGFDYRHNLEEVWLRPVASLYVHDFRTQHRTDPGYQNYADRSEVLGGIDVGHEFGGPASAFVGARVGRQEQEALPGSPVHYDSDLGRLLAGLEGELSPWATVKMAVGPDWRSFRDGVPAGFDREQVVLWSDMSFGLKLGAGDRVDLSYQELTQPGFGGRSVYQDRTAEAKWSHAWAKGLVGLLGFRAYNTDFEPPVVRDDWVYTTSVALSARLGGQVQAEISYTHDWGRSDIPNTSGREFGRDLVAVGLKWRLR